MLNHITATKIAKIPKYSAFWNKIIVLLLSLIH